MKVNEIFGGNNVVQGEGPFAGMPATFIRLWGCISPYCDFCDTKYSWTDEENESTEVTINKIIKEVKKFGKNKLVVITGGEPYVQSSDLYELCKKLISENFFVQIETSGKAEIINLPSPVNIIMSPKQYNGFFILSGLKNLKYVDYFKFVVENENEVKRVVSFVSEYNLSKSEVFLMAKGETREKQLKLMPKVFEWCNKYGFRYSPRLHVLAFNVKRGV